MTRAIFALILAASLLPERLHQSQLLWDTGTFSILGFDASTGEIGGAVQSRVFSVGNGVLWADADAGVVATQAVIDVGYGPQAIDLLRKGIAVEDLSDDRRRLNGRSRAANSP